jgi:outer membrane receptor protein involved in Fe transport
MRASAVFPKFDLAFDVNNALNALYIESGYVPMPGRLYRLSLSWKWNKEG